MYTSIPTQFATYIPQPVRPAETTDMSHQQTTQSSKEQVPALTGQFMTNATDSTDHNDLWRCNSGTNTATHMAAQDHVTRSTGHSGFQNTHRILQMQGMDPHASDVENKAIGD